MKTKKILFPSVLVCTALALTLRLFAKPASAKLVSPNQAYAAIDAYIEQQMRRLNIPGAALAIVEGDQIVHRRGFGQVRPGGEAPTPQTPFVIGSATKSFTALAVMQLVEAGQIELDAPIQRYLPWFRVADPQASAQITVRHLLNQTSALPLSPGWADLADFDDSAGATERHIRALATLKLTRRVPPGRGSAFEYSNSNYDILGLIVEATSGESYADYVQTHIFTPLGMNHSYTDQALAKQNGLAVGHQYWFWTPVAAPDLPIPRASLPSGQLIASAEDMAHYLIAQLNGGRSGQVQILSSASIHEMQRGAAEFREMGTLIGKYGMGWIDTENRQTKIIWHTGAAPDFSSAMALLPAQKKGVVLLLNAGHFTMEPIVSELALDLAALLAGQQPTANTLGFSFIRSAPWLMRALLLIPLLQIVGIAATLRRLRRWRQNPALHPSRGRMWGVHILLPLLPNLSFAALAGYLLVSSLRGFLLLFLPDFSWLVLIGGGFAGVWSLLRSGLILRTLRKPLLSAYSLDGAIASKEPLPEAERLRSA